MTARGASIVEALVGVALGALALAVLAGSAAVAARALSLAVGAAAQVNAAWDGIERLRGGATVALDDVVGPRPRIQRRGAADDGRGHPAAIRVDTSWAGGHGFTVESERWP